MKEENRSPRASKQEVVFVLRVRPGEVGWWGQVHRLDVGSLRLVAGHIDLFALLEHDWQSALSQEQSPSEADGP
ncbi:MAG: hypothetical protein M3014_03970 [Chloroflexota bacterium]|nr:hypothetical protein [Chloroflexota bacterium]